MSGHDRVLSPFELEEPLPSRPKASGSSCPTTRYSRQDPEDGRLDGENPTPDGVALRSHRAGSTRGESASPPRYR